MVLKHFIYHDDFLEIQGMNKVRIQGFKGEIDGYYQDHALGMVLYTPNHKLLQIGTETYNLTTLRELKYKVDGDKRRITLVDHKGRLLQQASYDVFWIDETDMMELAFELPEDITRDLLKFVSDQLQPPQPQAAKDDSHTAYFDSLKGSPSFEKICTGIDQGHIESVLLGEHGYSLATPADSVNQIASLVLNYLHTMIRDGYAKPDILEHGLRRISLSSQTFPLVLDYIYSYLKYRQKFELLELDVHPFWDKLKKSPFYDLNVHSVTYFDKNIKDLLRKYSAKKGNKAPSALKSKGHSGDQKISLNNKEEAMAAFLLWLINSSDTFTRFYPLSQFLNNQMGLFPQLIPMIKELSGQGLLENTAPANKPAQYAVTTAGKDYLLSLDQNQLFELLKEDISNPGLLQDLRKKFQ